MVISITAMGVRLSNPAPAPLARGENVELVQGGRGQRITVLKG